MPKITIKPQNIELEISEKQDLLSFLREKDVYVKSSCGGHASCGDCVIKISSGDENLTTPTFDETKLIGNVFHITKERLACQTNVTGNVTIDLSGQSKDVDEKKLLNKTKNLKKNTVLKKSSQLEEKSSINLDQQEESWFKHWEKKEEETPAKKKDRGGFARPKRPDYKKNKN